MAKTKQQDAATGAEDKTITTSTKPDVDQTVFGTLTEDELSGLTAAEREATEPDEEEEEGDEAAEGAEGAEGEDAGAEGGEGEEAEAGAEGEAAEGEEAEGEEAEGAEAEAAAAEGAVAEAEGVEAAAAEDDDEPAIPDWKMPDKAQETLDALEVKAREIATKFDEGTLSAGEFHTQMAANSDAKGTLLSAISKATMAQEMRVSHFTKATVPKFLKAHPEYDATKNPVLYRALDGEVRALQEAAGKKGENYLSPKVLRQAHANVLKAFGRQETALTPKTKNGKTPKLPDKSGRPVTPPTLARVPADTLEDVDGGKHARLDRMARTDPTGYEEALQKMPEADRDDYLHYASS